MVPPAGGGEELQGRTPRYRSGGNTGVTLLRGASYNGWEGECMPIEFLDALRANIVLVGITLLGEQPRRDIFAEMVDTEIDLQQVASGILPLAPGETGLSIQLRKDHIRIDSLPSRTVIEKEYPAFDDLERLAEIAGYAISLTNLEEQTLTAFGFNLDLVYRPGGEESAASYLAERLFPHQGSALEGCALVAGVGRLVFKGADGQWMFTIEPRGNDPSARRVFLGLNLHKDEPRIPSQEEILGSLQQAWRHLRDFATQLDGGE